MKNTTETITETYAAIKLGIDAHAKWDSVARQLDGATPQPVLYPFDLATCLGPQVDRGAPMLHQIPKAVELIGWGGTEKGRPTAAAGKFHKRPVATWTLSDFLTIFTRVWLI